MSKVYLMQGNQAVAEGAIAAGVKFFGGYPITPSTEVAESLAKMLPAVGGKFIQMEDEIAGIGVIIGASLAGMKVMTATSGPGFSLKQELIGYASIAEIPMVIVNVQRVGPSTGQPSSSNVLTANSWPAAAASSRTKSSSPRSKICEKVSPCVRAYLPMSFSPTRRSSICAASSRKRRRNLLRSPESVRQNHSATEKFSSQSLQNFRNKFKKQVTGYPMTCSVFYAVLRLLYTNIPTPAPQMRT